MRHLSSRAKDLESNVIKRKPVRPEKCEFPTFRSCGHLDLERPIVVTSLFTLTDISF